LVGYNHLENFWLADWCFGKFILSEIWTWQSLLRLTLFGWALEFGVSMGIRQSHECHNRLSEVKQTKKCFWKTLQLKLRNIFLENSHTGISAKTSLEVPCSYGIVKVVHHPSHDLAATTSEKVQPFFGKKHIILVILSQDRPALSPLYLHYCWIDTPNVSVNTLLYLQFSS
jgi:hypothetical protein